MQPTETKCGRVTQFAFFPFELSQTLTSLPHSLTSLKSSSMSTRFQKKSSLQFYILLKFVKYFSQENRGDTNCKNGEKHFVEPVMHPNLCVCFHSAVTFWLNDRLTVYCRAVNRLYNKSLPPHHHQTKQIYCPLWLYVCLSEKCPPLTEWALC